MPPLDGEIVQYCVYQKERCESTNREHLQGYIVFHIKKRMSWIKTYLGDNTIHLAVKRGTVEQARKYCMKEETRVEEPVEFGTCPVEKGSRTDLDKLYSAIKDGATKCEIIDSFPKEFYRYPRAISEHIIIEQQKKRKAAFCAEPIVLRPWQQNLLDRYLTPPLEGQRKQIIWIADVVGQSGKTRFSQYLVAHYNACILRSGKKEDLAYHYSQEAQKYVVFDMSRSAEFYPYSLMEEMQDGSIPVTKYNSHMVYQPCYVLVLANCQPNTANFSPNRHVVYTISDLTD